VYPTRERDYLASVLQPQLIAMMRSFHENQRLQGQIGAGIMVKTGVKSMAILTIRHPEGRLAPIFQQKDRT
jgi:hypothetical protein